MSIEKYVNIIISASDQYTGEMSAFGKAFAGIGIAALAVETAILAASAAAAKFAIDVGQSLVTSAQDYYDATLDVLAVTQGSGLAFEDVSEVLDDLTNKFPVTGKVAGEALKLIAQMGYDTKDELYNVSNAALTLSIAVNEDLNTAASAIVTTLNVFNLTSEDSETIINAIAAAANASALSVSDFNDAIKYVGTIMEMTQQPFEEMLAAMMILRDRGLEASQVGTRLQQALSSLLKPTDDARNALKNYGLTVEDVNPETHTLTQIIEAFGGQTISAGDAIRIFNLRGKEFATVINAGAEEFKNMTASVTGTSAATDAYLISAEKLDTVMKNLDGSMDLLRKTMGTDLLKAIVDVIGVDENSGLRGIITEITKLEDFNKDVSQIIVDAFERMGQAIRDAFGEDINADNLYNAIKDLALLLTGNLEVIVDWGIEFGKALQESYTGTEGLISVLNTLNAAIAAVAIPLAVIHDAFSILWSVATIGASTFQWILTEVFQKVNEALVIMYTQLDKLPWVDFQDEILEAKLAAEKWALTQKDVWDIELPNFWIDNVLKGIGGVGVKIKDLSDAAASGMESVNIEMVKASTSAQVYEDSMSKVSSTIYSVNTSTGELASESDKVKAAMEGVKFATGGMIGNIEQTGTAMEGASKHADDMEYSITQAADGTILISNETQNAATGARKLKDEFDNVKFSINDGVIEISNLADEGGRAGTEISSKLGQASSSAREIATATGESTLKMKQLADGTLEVSGSLQSVKIDAEQFKGVADGLSEIEMKLLTEKFKSDLAVLEIDAKGRWEVIKQKVEWQAKLDIAQVEASAKILETAFESAAAMTETIGQNLETTVGVIADLIGEGAHWTELDPLYEIIDRQLTMQEKLVDAQVALMTAQTELANLQIDRIKEGDPAWEIKVSIEGDVEGWLSGLLSTLMEEIIVKAQGEALACLCSTT